MMRLNKLDCKKKNREERETNTIGETRVVRLDVAINILFYTVCIVFLVGFLLGNTIKSNKIWGWTWDRAYAVGEWVSGDEIGENSINQFVSYRFQRYGENWIALQNLREGDWILKRVG